MSFTEKPHQPPPTRAEVATMTHDIVRHCGTQHEAAHRLGLTVNQVRTLINHPEMAAPDRLAYRIRTCHQLATGKKAA